MVIGEWNGIPGIVIVAPAFKFFDAADSAKLIEKELCMYSSYKPNYPMLHKLARRFAKEQIPLGFWI